MAIDSLARGLVASLLNEEGRITEEKMPVISNVVGLEDFEAVGKLEDPTLIEGKTSEEILKLILFGINFPVFIEPTLKIEINNTLPLLIGEEQSLSGTLIFDRGAITPAYGTGGFRAGGPISFSVQGKTEQYSENAYPFSFIDIPAEKDYLLLCSVSYAQGEQPLDSVGQDYDQPYPAGALNQIISLNAVYPLYLSTGELLTFDWAEDDSYEVIFLSENGGEKQNFAISSKATVTGIKAFNSLTQSWEWLGGSAENSLTHFDKTVSGELNLYVHNQPLSGRRVLHIYTE